MSNFKLLVLCLIVFLSQPTLGCEEYDEIDLGNLEKYSEIFVGEVMGVTLDGYQASRIIEISKGLIRIDANAFLGHRIQLLVTRQIKGESNRVIHAPIIPCSSPIPNLKMYGVFFIEEESGQIAAIYENQREYYYETLIRLSKNSH